MTHSALVLALWAGVLAGCLPSGVRPCSALNLSGTALASETCQFPFESTVVGREGTAVLLMWETEASSLWSSIRLPADTAYARYRRQIEAAGADQMHPAQFVPVHQRDEPFWARELRNVELAYGGEAGVIRPVQCLDALLFAFQNARVSQLERPTEFLASVLRKTSGGRTRLRVYFGAGDEMFPPKAVYGFDQVERDVADGWEYMAMLHNHTIQDADGEMRLGVPAPSISDVQLLTGLVERVGLNQAWVTNGVYTVVIDASALALYLGPE